MTLNWAKHSLLTIQEQLLIPSMGDLGAFFPSRRKSLRWFSPSLSLSWIESTMLPISVCGIFQKLHKKYRELGSLSNRNVFSHHSDGQKLASPGLVSPEASLLDLCTTVLSLCLHVVIALHSSVSVSKTPSPFYKDNWYWRKACLSDLILTLLSL